MGFCWERREEKREREVSERGDGRERRKKNHRDDDDDDDDDDASLVPLFLRPFFLSPLALRDRILLSSLTSPAIGSPLE
jgi:hypothetical protein